MIFACCSTQDRIPLVASGIEKELNKSFEKYSGDYEDERNPRIRLSVSMQGNTLRANSTRFKPVTLTAKSKSEFFAMDKDISIKFNLNKAGEVQSVTLVMGGRSSTFKKK